MAPPVCVFLADNGDRAKFLDESWVFRLTSLRILFATSWLPASVGDLEQHAPFLTATFNAGVNAYVLGLIIIATTQC